ncbi:MAG TPA: Dabb family protein [Candidatus Paceibacterota bacterium]
MAYRHIVLFSFKPDVTEKQLQEATDVLRTMKDIPGVTSIEIGRQIQPARDNGKTRYLLVEVMTFKDRESLEGHKTHPIHTKVGAYMRAAANTWTDPFDYEI